MVKKETKQDRDNQGKKFAEKIGLSLKGSGDKLEKILKKNPHKDHSSSVDSERYSSSNRSR